MTSLQLVIYVLFFFGIVFALGCVFYIIGEIITEWKEYYHINHPDQFR